MPSKKVPSAPKAQFDRDAYEAEQEERLKALALAYPDTGRGAKGGKARAQKAKTAAKVVKDFKAHKADILAMRAAGAGYVKARINFKKFLSKLRDQTGLRAKAKAAKAAKVLKKSVVKKL